MQEPIGVMRSCTRSSGQMTSNQARMWLTVAKVQAHALRLPRAQAAPKRRRREVRNRLVNFLSDVLILDADKALQEGDHAFARSNLLAALQIRLWRAVRPMDLQALAPESLTIQADAIMPKVSVIITTHRRPHLGPRGGQR